MISDRSDAVAAQSSVPTRKGPQLLRVIARTPKVFALAAAVVVAAVAGPVAAGAATTAPPAHTPVVHVHPGKHQADWWW